MIRFLMVSIFALISASVHAASSSVACTMEYAPVCATKPVQCIQAPCDPVRQTYSNSCMAAADGASLIWTGECNIAESGPIAIGGQRDAHGCLIGAGYTWDRSLGQCARLWEQKMSVQSALQAGTWKSVSLNGVAFSGATLSFEKNTIHAKICNTMNGQYSITRGGKLLTRRVISTLMYCDGPLMSLETALSRGSLSDIIVGSGSLTLQTKGGDEIIWSR